ncbi:hypothetical protein ACFQ67_24325 [Streptomyces sp. NPDC056488]|uniref:hypothetical protein n=1 Tax=unclassified Streptomyces TaxID=2593676 RepID=UPI0036AEE353
MTPTVRLPAPAPAAADARVVPAAGRRSASTVLVPLLPVADPAERVTALTRPAYAGDMITGVLPAACAAVLLRRRSAGA